MNIIYFNPDQMRADYLGCYGHPSAKTPNIDGLAADGVRFDQCHVQHTVCTPSRCSIMTGWYPHVRGHRTLWYPLQPDEPNTLKYLKKNGYGTHWIGKNDLLAQESFEDSVTAMHFTQPGASGDRRIFKSAEPGYWSFLYGPMPGHNDDWYIIEKAIQFLRSRKRDDPIECFDIMPTTLELAGIECEHTHFARSMVPQLRGGPGDLERAVFAEGGYDTNESHCYEGTPTDIGANPDAIYYPKGRQQQEHPASSVRCTMIRTLHHKLVYRPEELSELYDLASDPQELHNVYGQQPYADTQQKLERRILDWYVHTSDVVPFERQFRGYSGAVKMRWSEPSLAEDGRYCGNA